MQDGKVDAASDCGDAVLLELVRSEVAGQLVRAGGLGDDNGLLLAGPVGAGAVAGGGGEAGEGDESEDVGELHIGGGFVLLKKVDVSKGGVVVW